ncbi:hypothetical protein Nepgr_002187 [Nepenthes gracilis]|uniref:Uncharacterized protein n=1 Tax=Nepenthes gracilis TaxID=150966 RepID=A0AAD3RY50_NEPGR|nr:hypothetical protein Nepgr_002187 [Nepenthes gracilis]
MAEETQKPAAEAQPAQEAVASVVPEAEIPDAAVEKEVPSHLPAVLDPEPETDEKPALHDEEAAVLEEKSVPAENQKIVQSDSFNEETNVVSDLPESQRKALEEFKKLIKEALEKHEFTTPPPPALPAVEKTEEKPPAQEADVPLEAKEELEVLPADDKKAEEASAALVAESAEEIKQPPKTEEAAEEPLEAKTEPPPQAKEEEQDTTQAKEELVEQVETSVVVDDDGEKTVEAIEETIIPVSAPPPVAEQHPPQEKESEEVAVAPASAPAEEPQQEAQIAGPPAPPEEVFLWGIPLLGDERSDVILLKFLRARDFKVKEAFSMIKNTVRWREEFGVESLLDEDLGNDYDKVVFTHGTDKGGRPVVYNVFGEFQKQELNQSTFSDAEKQKKFLRWLIQFLEKTVRKLDFSPTGVCSLVLVTDLKNSPGYGKKVINKFLQLLQDNYPEFVSKQACINVSWWYLAYSWIYISVFTPRSKSKFVFASSSKTAEILFKYIAPEHVPVQYGGHSRAGELEFTSDDPVSEVNVKSTSKYTVELPFDEPCVVLWELRVLGWDVNYDVQFVPSEGYTVLVSKPRKMTVSDDPIISDSFKITEPGKVILSVDNHSSKKKKVLYRSKIKPSD